MRTPVRLVAGVGALAMGLLADVALPAASPAAPEQLYQSYCLDCHGPGRRGGLGPPLLPADLGHLKKADAWEVIANGLTDTHMPGFASQLSGRQIDALVNLIYQSPGASASPARRRPATAVQTGRTSP